MFTRQELSQNLTRLQTSKVKTGAAGVSANKGSTSIRFNYQDTSFLLLNCHLMSGQSKVQERFHNL
jgi:hypothetical protein